MTSLAALLLERWGPRYNDCPSYTPKNAERDAEWLLARGVQYRASNALEKELDRHGYFDKDQPR